MLFVINRNRPEQTDVTAAAKQLTPLQMSKMIQPMKSKLTLMTRHQDQSPEGTASHSRWLRLTGKWLSSVYLVWLEMMVKM